MPIEDLLSCGDAVPECSSIGNRQSAIGNALRYPVSMRWLAWSGLTAGALVAMAALWRLARRPCPPWPGFLIENPYTDVVAGAARLVERAGIAAGMRVLDAGCGPGRVTIEAAARVGPAGRVVALDVQARMLDRLRRRVAAAGVANVDARRGSLGDGTLPADLFDIAMLADVLGEVPDPSAALRDLHRALRPGGVLSVTDVLPNPMYVSLARVRTLARRAGFVEDRAFVGWTGYTVNLRKA